MAIKIVIDAGEEPDAQAAFLYLLSSLSQRYAIESDFLINELPSIQMFCVELKKKVLKILTPILLITRPLCFIPVM